MNRNLNRIHPIAEADGLSPKKHRNIATKDGSIYDAETGRFVGYEREDY